MRRTDATGESKHGASCALAHVPLVVRVVEVLRCAACSSNLHCLCRAFRLYMKSSCLSICISTPFTVTVASLLFGRCGLHTHAGIGVSPAHRPHAHHAALHHTATGQWRAIQVTLRLLHKHVVDCRGVKTQESRRITRGKPLEYKTHRQVIPRRTHTARKTAPNRSRSACRLRLALAARRLALPSASSPLPPAPAAPAPLAVAFAAADAGFAAGFASGARRQLSALGCWGA